MRKKINYFDEDYDEQVERASSFGKVIRGKLSEIKTMDIPSKMKAALPGEIKTTDISSKIKTALSEKSGKKQYNFLELLRGILILIYTSTFGIARRVARRISRDGGKRGLRFALLFGATLFVLIVMIGSVALTFNIKNNRNEKFANDAGKVCASYILDYGNCSYENLYNSYGIVGYQMTGLCYARQMDFDNDGNDELFLCYNDSGKYYAEVWGYNGDKKFTRFLRESAAQSDDKSEDAWVTIYYKNKKYYIGTHDEKDITKVDLYQLKGEEFDKKNSCEYDPTLEAFIIKDKVQYDSFERIKLSVLSEQKAIVTSNQVSEVIDDFTSVTGLVSNTNTGTSLKSAYNEIVQKHLKTYGAPSYKTADGYSYIDGLACVKQIDFDGDGTNELLVMYRKAVRVREEDYNGNYIATTRDTYYCEVYKYNGKNAVMVYQKDSVSNLLNDNRAQYVIIKNAKKKHYLCTNTFSSENYGRIVNARSNVLKFDGERFVSQQKLSYYNEYGYTQYYIDDERVYRSEFGEKGNKTPFFDGEDGYDTNTYEVIFLQQKTADAADMDTQIASTTTEISKLK